jgi:hypothetical protein
MNVILTTAEALAHLRLGDGSGLSDTETADVQTKLEEAEGVILDYLKTEAVYTPATAPTMVKAAVKLFLAHSYEHRGDDLDGGSAEQLWEEIARVLRRSRDPALA